MDLGGGVSFHIAKLITQNGYDRTITLNSNLYVDVLSLTSSAEVTGTKGLAITQRTSVKNGVPVATVFGASSVQGAAISTSYFYVYAELDHQVALELGTAFPATFLNTNFSTDYYSAVNWRAGNIVVEKGKTVTNGGTFLMDSDGMTFGNTGGAADKWTFQNNYTLTVRAGKLQNEDLKNARNGKVIKTASATPGATTFEISDAIVLATLATIEVDSGTLQLDSTLTQSDGNINVNSGTLAVVGAITQTGGTITEIAGTTISAASVSVGGTLALQAGTLQSAGDVDVVSGGTLTGAGTVTTGGTLIDDGTITIDGSNTMYGLVVTGDYSQTGVLNMQISSSSYAVGLHVSGLASLGGTLNVTPMSGSGPFFPGSSFQIVSYGSYSGSFGTLNLPTPMWGTWDPRFNDPTYPDAFSLWVI